LTLRSLYGDFGQNLAGVIAKSQLFITIAYSAACILFVGAALRILIPAMLKNADFSDSMIGYAMSLIALGTIAGALVCGKFARDFSTRSVMLYWCLYGIALSLLPLLIGSGATILAGCLLLGIVGAFVDVAMPTNIQKLSTNSNIGKNFSLFSTLANTGEALSGGLAGLLVLFSSVGVSVTLIGLLTASVAYVGKLKSAGQE
jgi:MFS transporter, DHA3 family, macrolide efflux protein